MTSLISILVITASAATAGSLPELVKPFPIEVLRNEVVEFKPKAEHHFSMEAPQKCQGNAPVEATARTIKCQFVQPGENSATLNVCDDKKTFCKPVTVTLNVAEKSSGEPVRLLKNEHLNKNLKSVLVPGFTMGMPEEIAKVAFDKKQMVLVMISTDWCPPCNEAKEYLLNSDAFQRATQDWFKVYVDGDSLAAAVWEKTVPYKYYPSFVVLNPRMEEVGRFYGEARQNDFVTWAKEQSRLGKDPIQTLKKRVLARQSGGLGQKIKDLFGKGGAVEHHADEVRLLRWALDQKDQDVMRTLSHGSYPELAAEFTKYQIDQIDEQEKPDKAQKLVLLRRLVDSTLSGEEWAGNVEGLCDEDEGACKEQLLKVNEREKILAAKAGLTEAEKASMLGSEYYSLASIYDKLKNPEKKKEFAGKCVAAYETLKTQSRLKLPRGAQQTLIPCLEFSERFREAEQLLTALVETYPNEPTFMQRMARTLRKQKKLDQALVWIEKAENVAYGFNWFSTELIKTDILLDLKREKDAQNVILAALNEVRVGEDRDNRNQLVAARLRAQQTKIQERLVK